jgi:hypothetical protein
MPKCASSGDRTISLFGTIDPRGIAQLVSYLHFRKKYVANKHPDDYNDPRAGDRVCSLGEAPYLDLNSRSRKESLGLM